MKTNIEEWCGLGLRDPTLISHWGQYSLGNLGPIICTLQSYFCRNKIKKDPQSILLERRVQGEAVWRPLLVMTATSSLSRSCKSRRTPKLCTGFIWGTATPSRTKELKVPEMEVPNIPMLSRRGENTKTHIVGAGGGVEILTTTTQLPLTGINPGERRQTRAIQCRPPQNPRAGPEGYYG